MKVCLGWALYQLSYWKSFSSAPPYHCRSCILIRYARILDPTDALMCGPHQSDGNPILDVSARPQVGLLPLCYEAAGYTFQGIHSLHIQYPINRGEEWVGGWRKWRKKNYRYIFFFALTSSWRQFSDVLTKYDTESVFTTPKSLTQGSKGHPLCCFNMRGLIPYDV